MDRVGHRRLLYPHFYRDLFSPPLHPGLSCCTRQGCSEPTGCRKRRGGLCAYLKLIRLFTWCQTLNVKHLIVAFDIHSVYHRIVFWIYSCLCMCVSLCWIYGCSALSDDFVGAEVEPGSNFVVSRCCLFLFCRSFLRWRFCCWANVILTQHKCPWIGSVGGSVAVVCIAVLHSVLFDTPPGITIPINVQIQHK